MRRYFWGFLFTAASCGVLIALVLYASYDRIPDISAAVKMKQEPVIDPDYASLVIPPNIAPLNFRILEQGQDFVVVVSSEAGQSVKLHCPDGGCQIPIKAWRQLLKDSEAGRLFFDIFVQDPAGVWRQFSRISNRVASEPIDSYIVYRRLVPNKFWSNIRGIYQRDLESFRKSALITTRDDTIKCFNCHTFHQHNPDQFLFHVRGEFAGMVIVKDGKVTRIDTKQDPMFRPLAYAAWHPGGRHIAATCNRFLGHSPANARTYYFQALDKRGDLVVYDVEKNALRTTEAVFGHQYIETHPCWSADGKYIYYCRAEDLPMVEPEDWELNDFDLMRVSYDVLTDTWGSPEIVKAYSELGLSCSFPRPSPCGKYVLHMLADKTSYPIHQESSDLYLLDLDTKEYRKLEAVCSPLAESYPRWSSNGRWFSFLSSRDDGMSALPYLAYFDEQGEAGKAFVVPQQDPGYYDTFIDTYNALELVKSRVNISSFRLAHQIQQKSIKARFPKPPQVDAYSGPTRTLPAGYRSKGMP